MRASPRFRNVVKTSDIGIEIEMERPTLSGFASEETSISKSLPGASPRPSKGVLEALPPELKLGV